MDINELNDIAEKTLSERKRVQVRCCMASGCLSSDAKAVKDSLTAAAGGSSDIDVVRVGCMGQCSLGPLVTVETAAGANADAPSPIMYERVTAASAPSIIGAVRGEPCEVKTVDTSHPFFSRQVKIVCENSGTIDPESIEDYIAAGGYLALHSAIYDMNPEEVIKIVTDSGLRGRGGAGYPTGLKWATVAKSPAEKRFVVCNADEGDPGAFMNRSVLESDPHRVLEGMAIAAYAVGANQGYVYCRGEYPLAISRVQTAIKRARHYGILGTQVFESGFDFRIEIRIGAGAFVCGEETALMSSVEGQRGTPRPRPPYPAQSGLWGHPTLLNNVETYANVAGIIRNGADWFAGIGTARCKGTKIFALAGKVKNVGLVEVPMGTPLRTIVEEMGGGTDTGGPVKAVQTGGPSGGCIPRRLFDSSVDYETLAQLGSIMGSGGMIVMDEKDDMVEIAKFFMEFCMDESCGKCIPCRAGTVQIHRLLTKIGDGKATEADLDLLRSLCDMVSSTSLCGLGQSAPNPVLSTLRYFPEDYTQKLTSGTGVPHAKLEIEMSGQNGAVHGN
ncbi:MAG: NADH-ubiquinone oxidoreductase-F iron-sulfur binding region domain-containing protein [Capsulimonadaceae bacterium]